MEAIIAASAPKLELDEDLYTALYDDVFPVVASLISRQKGSLADAEDIFQDAIIALLDANQRLAIDDHRKYIVGIAKHLWLRRSGNNSRHVALDDFERLLSIPEIIPDDKSPSRLLHFLERTGRKCMELLSDFYFAGLSISQVAVRHGLQNAHSASVQKHKCVEKLRAVVKTKSYSYGDFTD